MNDSSSKQSSKDTKDSATKPRKGRASHLTRIIRSSVLALVLIGLGAALGFCEEPIGDRGWSSSYDSAVVDAEATGKPIMLVFTGSDWCVWCQKLDQEILQRQEFLAWSSSNVAKVEIDFPQNTSLPTEVANQNKALMTKYGQHVQSFPTVLFVDAQGTVLAKTGYISNDVNNWINNAEQILPATPESAVNGDNLTEQIAGN